MFQRSEFAIALYFAMQCSVQCVGQYGWKCILGKCSVQFPIGARCDVQFAAGIRAMCNVQCCDEEKQLLLLFPPPGTHCPPLHPPQPKLYSIYLIRDSDVTGQ